MKVSLNTEIEKALLELNKVLNFDIKYNIDNNKIIFIFNYQKKILLEIKGKINNNILIIEDNKRNKIIELKNYKEIKQFFYKYINSLVTKTCIQYLKSIDFFKDLIIFNENTNIIITDKYFMNIGKIIVKIRYFNLYHIDINKDIEIHILKNNYKINNVDKLDKFIEFLKKIINYLKIVKKEKEVNKIYFI